MFHPPTEGNAMTDKVKRTVLTPEQRVAKLEAELTAAKAKAEKRANKQRDMLLERRSKLTIRANELLTQIEAIDAELDSFGVPATGTSERVEDIDVLAEGSYV
jgi:hypothetical protein